MKVKELIERLQSLDQELDVYIYNDKESSLFLAEDVHETSDFGENKKGENEWENFVTIFPSSNTQPLYTLSAEEGEIVIDALKHAIRHIGYLETYDFASPCLYTKEENQLVKTQILYKIILLLNPSTLYHSHLTYYYKIDESLSLIILS